MDPVFIAFICVIVALLLLLSRKDPRLPPGPFELPIIGTVSFFLIFIGQRSYLKYFVDLANNYGSITSVKSGLRRIVTLNDAAAVNEVFVKMADLFSDRPIAYRSLALTRSVLGDGIVSSSAPLTKEIRRLALSTMRDLGVGKLTLEQRIIEETEFVVAAMEAHRGEPMNYTTLIQNAVSNIICSIIFGQRFDYDDERFKRILTTVQVQFSADPTGFLDVYLPGWIAHSKLWLAIDPTLGEEKKILATYSEFLRQLVDEHRQSFDPNNVRDFIDVFLKEEQRPAVDGAQAVVLNDGNVLHAIQDLFLAGTETTSTTLMWTFAFMLNHPAAFSRVQLEIDQVVGRDRAPSLKDRSSMPFTEAVLHEVQRIACIASYSVEHTANRDVMVGKCLIPKGAVVYAFIFNIHMNPAVWPEPYHFRPERWLDAAGNFRMLESFMPFSVGRRVCLGEQLARMELFLFFTTLAQRFNFLSGQPDGCPPNLQHVEGFTISCKPFLMRAVRR